MQYEFKLYLRTSNVLGDVFNFKTSVYMCILIYKFNFRSNFNNHNINCTFFCYFENSFIQQIFIDYLLCGRVSSGKCLKNYLYPSEYNSVKLLSMSHLQCLPLLLTNGNTTVYFKIRQGCRRWQKVPEVQRASRERWPDLCPSEN